MPQFFVKSADIIDGTAVIKGDDFNHLKKVRRVKPGDSVNVRVENGSLLNAVVSEIQSDRIIAKITGEVERNTIAFNLTLYAGLLKGKMFDFVLQKATEIGASRIVPVITERAVPVISEKKMRWDKIVDNAAKQCMRSDIPEIGNIMSFDKAVTEADAGVKIIAHTVKSDNSIRNYLASVKNENKDAAISVLVGSEGGFTEEEIELAEASDWMRLDFGFTALRAETAAIVIPAIIIHEWSLLN